MKSVLSSVARRDVLPDSFAFTSPYNGFWLKHFFAEHSTDLFQTKVKRERDFRRLLDKSEQLPELMLMGNFIVERAGILALCHELGINSVHGEDGFFPHYATAHADPLGFCWESSLSKMMFRQLSDSQRTKARAVRENWLSFEEREVSPEIKGPFVLWPLQLIGDKVNRWDLNVSDWTTLLAHFRECLPIEYQLVVKPHPRSQSSDLQNVEQWAKEAPNTLFLAKGYDLKTLLKKCNAVAGANSTVLYEARLMFHKPTYAYARSWFTSHSELIVPLYRQHSPRLPGRFDWVEDNRKIRSEYLDDYTDWFLAQLLARQVSHELGQNDPTAFRRRVRHLSRQSFIQHGEDIFNDC